MVFEIAAEGGGIEIDKPREGLWAEREKLFFWVGEDVLWARVV